MSLLSVNGEKIWMSARKVASEDISKWMNLRTLQAGDTSAVRYRKHWQTTVPSIQGPWTPFTHKNPLNNLVLYPDTSLGEILGKEQSATEKLLELTKEKQIQAKGAEKELCKE